MKTKISIMKKLFLLISLLFAENIFSQIIGITGAYSLQKPENIFFPDRVINNNMEFYGRYTEKENGQYIFSNYHYDFRVFNHFSTSLTLNTLSKFIINNFELGYSIVSAEYVNSFSVYPNTIGFSAKQLNIFELSNMEIKLGRCFILGSKYNRFILHNYLNIVSIFNIANNVNIKLGEPGFDNGNGNATFQKDYLSRINKINYGLELKTELSYTLNNNLLIALGYTFQILQYPFSSVNLDAIRQTNNLNQNLNLGNIVEITDGPFFNHFTSIGLKYIPQSIKSQKFRRRLNRL
jgi:hypothetical protein